MKYLLRCAACCLGLGALGLQPARADDEQARQEQRQQERERLQHEQLLPQPDVRLPRERRLDGLLEADPTDLPCFPVRSVTLQGDGSERFAFALEALLQRHSFAETPLCLGSRGVGRVMQAVQNEILRRGFVTTRVLAQAQDLRSGTLVLTVVPGRVRQVRVDDAGTQRATSVNALPTGAGRLLDLRDIEQGLENFKRLPSVDADVQIVATDEPGLSDLLVTWTQGTPLRLNASLDDAGSQSTGRLQGSLTLSYDHWLTLNDLLYVSLSHDVGNGGHGSHGSGSADAAVATDGGDPVDSARRKGTRGNAIHYSLPLGYWTVGLTASNNNYLQSVAGASQNYRYGGDSSNAELRVSRMLHRSAVRKTSAYFAGWSRRSENFIDGTEVEVQRRRMAGFDVGLTHREFIGAASLDATLSYRQGTGAQGAQPAPEEAFGEGTSRPRIWRADAQLSAPFKVDDQRLRYVAALRAQWNRTALIPQDRFSIGNRYTVRGFDGESTLSADRGWLLRNELAWSLPGAPAELYVGADLGEVGGPSAQQLLGRRLAGAVVGLRGSWLGASVEAFAGRALHKPEGYRTADTTLGFNLSWSY